MTRTINIGDVNVLPNHFFESYTEESACHCNGCLRMTSWYPILKRYAWWGLVCPFIWTGILGMGIFLQWSTKNIPLRYDQYLEIRGTKQLLPISEERLETGLEAYIETHFEIRRKVSDLMELCVIGQVIFVLLVLMIVYLVRYSFGLLMR